MRSADLDILRSQGQSEDLSPLNDKNGVKTYATPNWAFILRGLIGILRLPVERQPAQLPESSSASPACSSAWLRCRTLLRGHDILGMMLLALGQLRAVMTAMKEPYIRLFSETCKSALMNHNMR
jgi:hypothetical protein